MGILAWAATFARSDSLDIGERYQMRIWNAKDGLQNRSLNATTADSKGYIWIATLGGLIRFDGSEFDELNISQIHRPRGNNIRHLTRTLDGDIVLQPTSGKILYIRERYTKTHPASQWVEGKNPRNMHGTSDGALWISVEDGSALRWTPKQHEWFLPSEGQASTATFASFAEDKEGATWVRTNRLFGRYAAGKFTPTPDNLGKPLLIGNGSQGSVVAVFENQLAKYENGELQVLASKVPWESDPSQISKLLTDKYGTIWIAAGRFGLLHWREGAIYPSPEKFNLVRDVFKDQDGNVWASSHGNGLGLVTRRATKLVDKAVGLQEDVSTSVYQDEEGSIWLANANGGLYKMVDDVPHKIHLSFQNKELQVNALSIDSHKTLWLGNNSGIYRSSYPYRSVQKISQIEGEVHLIFTDSQDQVWFATTYGRFGASTKPALFGYIVDDEVTLLDSETGYNGRAIETIEENGNGDIWAGTYDGEILRYRDGKVELLRSGRSVTDIYADPDQRLWITTTSDIYLYQNEQFTPIGQNVGMPIRYSHSVNEDSDGYLWFGLYKVRKSDLLETIAEQRDYLSIEFAPPANTSLDFDFLINWFPTTQIDPQGKLWTATSSGVLVFDPATVSLSRSQPQAYLDALKINDQRVSTDTLVEIPPSPHRIEADFSIPYFSHSRNIQIRYRLQGADTDWIKAERNQIISYSALAPGSYTLEYEAGSIGAWDGNRISIPIYVKPHWWQTLWFRLLGAAVAGIVLALIVKRWSQHRLQINLLQLEQEQALERERNRIARDLHDDLGGGLTALQLQATRIARDAANGSQKELQQLAKRARQLNADVHSIVWLFTPGDGTIKGIAELIQRYATDIFKTSNIELTSGDPFSLPELAISSDAQHNIFLAAKEALTNVLKHSQATAIRVDFVYRDDCLYCSIVDDGIGFSSTSDRVLDGNGLPNMAKRMEEIGGSIKIASKPEQGTNVTLCYQANATKRKRSSKPKA